MDNGQDANGNYYPPPQNNLNGNFNGNIFPFPLPFFPPQQQYLQPNYNDEMMGDFNNNQFAYNMASGVNLNQQYSPSQPGLVSQQGTSSPAPAQSVPDPPQRAAELRQKLIAMRKSSATPPNNNSSPTNMPKQSQAPKAHDQNTHAQPGDTDLDNLLSEARSAAEGTASQLHVKNERKTENSRPVLQTPTKNPATPKGSSAAEKSSPTMNKSTTRYTKERSVQPSAEMSDGEIHEDPKPRRPLPPTGPKESELSVVKRKQSEDNTGRERRDDLLSKQPEKKVTTDTNPNHSPSNTFNRQTVLRSREDRKDTTDFRRGGVSERQPRTEPKRHERGEELMANERKDRDRIELIDSSIKPKLVRQKSQSPKPEEAHMEQGLAENEERRLWLDLTGYNNIQKRETLWLEMTGYNDVPKRETKLKKYREYLAVVQRQKELEAEIEGMGGFRQATADKTQVSTTAMPPPPTPTKVKNESNNQNNVTRRNESASNGRASPKELIGKRGRENDDMGKESEKYPRLDSDGRGPKITGEGPSGYRRDTQSRSSGEFESGRYNQENGRRRSPSPRANRPDSRDSGREYTDRGRGRGYDRNQDYEMSGSRAYDNRPPARRTSRDREFSQADNDDWKSRRLNESTGSDYGDYRGGSARGGYRGKNWDPHYNENRGRGFSSGRGRGRGSDPTDVPQRAYGNGSAMKPKGFRESWDRGGKGDTRFFIIKSFNEENILHCQKDSIWTTQEHNAQMLIEAFNKCKNVIFCFSINSSKHFQGYARMESVPGSEPSPIWQNKIRFPTAGAFRIKWLTVANTHFSRVGHLKNNLNEGNKVYVGKDGQEIEEDAGRELVNIIDEEFEHRYRGVFEDPPGDDGGVVIKEERGGGFNPKGYRTYREPGKEVGEIQWL